MDLILGTESRTNLLLKDYWCLYAKMVLENQSFTLISRKIYRIFAILGIDLVFSNGDKFYW